MIYKPHEYQQRAIEWLKVNPRAALFAEPGTGKTSMVLTALLDLMLDSFEISKTLVIAPAKVVELKTWPNEIQKWDHLQGIGYISLDMSPRQRLRALSQNHTIFIISRELVPWIVNAYKKAWPFDCLVIDELSSFKNPSSQRFKALRKVAGQCKRVYGLTGTPTPNGYTDLWSQIYLLDQGQRLGKTLGEYRQMYFDPDKRNQQIIFSWKLKLGVKELIDEKISDLCLAIQAEDLPELLVNDIIFPLNTEAQKVYAILERDMILDESVTAASKGVVINKLLQIAGGSVYQDDHQVRVVHDQKLEILDELIEATDKPLLVFYNYRHERDRIFERFASLHPRELMTDQDQQDWNAGKIKLLIAHPASVGYGLNIQYGSNTIVWFGLTWSLELYQQANARLWRQGQTQGVIIHRLIAKDTVDELVVAALDRKELTQDNLYASLVDKVRQDR